MTILKLSDCYLNLDLVTDVRVITGTAADGLPSKRAIVRFSAFTITSYGEPVRSMEFVGDDAEKLDQLYAKFARNHTHSFTKLPL